MDPCKMTYEDVGVVTVPSCDTTMHQPQSQPQSQPVYRRQSPTALHLILLNAIVCGLLFCSSAGFTYIPPMLLKAGIPERYMSIVLGLGPLLGFFLVPVIGRSSDRCRSQYGRRRPYILGLSILVIISLVLIPYGELAANYTLGKGDFSKILGIGIMIIGIVLLDFASEVCLTPCEALLSDTCNNTDHSAKAFTYYSFMVSFGGCIGYLMAALDWKDSSVGLYFGGQEQSAFSLLIVLFTVTMVITLVMAGETPLDQLEEEQRQANNNHTCDSIVHDMQINIETEQSVAGCNQLNKRNGPSSTNSTINDEQQEHLEQCQYSQIITLTDKTCSISFKQRIFNRCHDVCSILWSETYTRLPSTVQNLVNIPFVLRPLVITNFFSWSALMSFNLFFTDFVGQAIYEGNPSSDSDDLVSIYRYDEGVREASWGLLYHCITSALYGGYFIEKLVQYYGIKKLYLFGNLSFVFAMLGILLCHDVTVVNILAAITGFSLATLTTVPFWLITQYHENKEIYFYDAPNGNKQNGSRGIGADVACLDSAYFLSQVLLSACMGYIVDITESVEVYIVVAAILGVAGLWSSTNIIYEKHQMVSMTRH